MLLSLGPLRKLLAKHAKFDYSQAYRDGANKYHGGPQYSARQYDPSSWKTYDLGPGRGLSVGYTAERKTELAPSTANSVENMATTPRDIIHPGFSSTGRPMASTTHLDPTTRKWVREAPLKIPEQKDFNGKTINTFDIRPQVGKTLGMSLKAPGPVEPQRPGLMKTMISDPLQAPLNMWNYLSGQEMN